MDLALYFLYIIFTDQLHLEARVREKLRTFLTWKHCREILLFLLCRWFLLIFVPHTERKLHLGTSLSDYFWKGMDFVMYIVFQTVGDGYDSTCNPGFLGITSRSEKPILYLVRGCVQVPCVSEASTPLISKQSIEDVVWILIAASSKMSEEGDILREELLSKKKPGNDDLGNSQATYIAYQN